MSCNDQREDRVFANIKSATPLPEGISAPDLFNEKVSLDINSIPFREIDELPEFIQKKMKSSEEYIARVRHEHNMDEAGLGGKTPNYAEGEADEDDIPM